MKRFLFCCLAAALIFAMLLPLGALASERPLWEQWGYESLEEFLEDNRMTEDEYFELERWRDTDQPDDEEQHRLEALEEMGGTPGIINVMYNGEFIKFGNALPEISGSAAFVPARPFFEAIGANFSYDAQSRAINMELGDMNARIVIGQSAMFTTQSGDEKEHYLGAAPYIKSGVTFIPIGAVSEALGFEVFWDSEYGCVVILDTEGVIAEIDKNFTIYNKMYDMPLNALSGDGATYGIDLNLLVAVTLFNSLDGDTAVEMGAEITILSDGRNFSMTGKGDFSQLPGLLLDDEMYMYYDDDELELIKRLPDALKDAEIELIVNSDENTVYVRLPVLSEFIPEVPKGAWIAVSGVSDFFEMIEIEDILEEISFVGIFGRSSMGADIVSEVHRRYWRRNHIFMYEEIMEIARNNITMYGDDKFKKNGNDYTLTITLDDMVTDAGGGYYGLNSFTKYDLELIIKTDGEEVTDIAGKHIYRYGWWSVTQYAYELAMSRDSLYIGFEVHQQNSMVVRIEMDAKSAQSTQKIPTVPPEGDTVISIEELFPDEFQTAGGVLLLGSD